MAESIHSPVEIARNAHSARPKKDKERQPALNSDSNANPIHSPLVHSRELIERPSSDRAPHSDSEEDSREKESK